MTGAEIITAIITQCGTDASRATVLAMLNEQYAIQVAESRWYRTTTTIGSTVAGQAQYPVPTAIIEAFGAQVGGITYAPIGEDSLWQVRSGRASLNYGSGGVFAQTYTDTGALVMDIAPIPDVAGSPIVLLAAMQAAPLTDGANVPITPLDSHGSLIDGTLSLVLERVDERPDLAAGPRARFEMWTDKLRRRRNTMLRGSGPLQMQVAGKHF